MVLNEYASRIVEMVRAVKKLDASDRLEMISIVSFPNQTKVERQKTIDRYLKVLRGDRPADPESVKRDREALLKKLQKR